MIYGFNTPLSFSCLCQTLNDSNEKFHNIIKIQSVIEGEHEAFDKIVYLFTSQTFLVYTN